MRIRGDFERGGGQVEMLSMDTFGSRMDLYVEGPEGPLLEAGRMDSCADWNRGGANVGGE
jgi:hypothetical protein